MAIHLHRDLERLKKELALIGSLVEEATAKAVLAMTDRREELAKEVLDGDKVVDQREVLLEEECLKVLALHQPVAHDLRFVITVLKVNNDLERVGDLAGNLAERVIELVSSPPLEIPAELAEMAAIVPSMLRHSLNALLQLDTDLARRILQDDERVDDLHARIFATIGRRMADEPDRIADLMQLLSASRYLERTADLATNIAEDVIFLVDGDVVRHLSW